MLQGQKLLLVFRLGQLCLHTAKFSFCQNMDMEMSHNKFVALTWKRYLAYLVTVYCWQNIETKLP